MSTQQPGQSQWLWNTEYRQYYFYDERTDSVVYADGRRTARPVNIPRTAFDSTAWSSMQTATTPYSSYTFNAVSSNPGYTALNSEQQYYKPSAGPNVQYGSATAGSSSQNPRQDSARASSSQGNNPAQYLTGFKTSMRYPQSGSAQYPQPVSPQVRVDEDGQRIIEATDPTSKVRTTFQTAPVNAITDPALLKQGKHAYRRLLSSDNEGFERLFESFHKRDQPRKFFTVGRVFLILWVEPAGESNTVVTDVEEGTNSRSGEGVFAKVRRFVVIREGDAYCSALPITTYGHRGVGKPGVTKSEHSIIYTTKSPPDPLPAELPTRGEIGMLPHAIRIDADDSHDQLGSLSRLDYSRVHTIQHNIQVKGFGKVNPKSMSALMSQCNSVWSSSYAQHAGESVSGKRSVQEDNQRIVPSQPVARRSSQVSARTSSMTKPTGGLQAHSDGRKAVYDADRANDLRATARATVQRPKEHGYTESQAINAVRKGPARSRDAYDDEDDEDDEGSDEEPSTAAEPAACANQLHNITQRRQTSSGQGRDRSTRAPVADPPPAHDSGRSECGEEKPSASNDLTSSQLYQSSAKEQDLQAQLDSRSMADTLPVHSDSGYYTGSFVEPVAKSTLEVLNFEDNLSIKTDGQYAHILPATKERLIQMFADELSCALQLRHDHQISGICRAIEILPNLLKNFTVLKSGLAKLEPEINSLVFVRHSRVAISSKLNDIVATSSPAFNIPNNAPLDLSDKISRWNMEDVPGIEEEHEVIEAVNGLDISDARHFLLAGDEYEWLTARLRSMNSMNVAACRCYSTVNRSFFDGVKIETQPSGQEFTMRFDLNWNPRAYLTEQFGSIVNLASTIVVVRDHASLYATTCGQYLEQVWPVHGHDILSAVNDSVMKEEDNPELRMSGSYISIRTVEDTISVVAKGGLAFLNDAFEVLVWLGTACRASPDDEISLCEPIVRTGNTAELVLAADVDFTCRRFDLSWDSLAPCWPAMFRNPVIADGYPAPHRYNDEPGLEVSAEMMVVLAQTLSTVCFRGHLLIKGFNSMLAPTRRKNESVLWHFLVQKDASYLSYTDGVKLSVLSSYAEAFFPGSRHFVGWSDFVAIAPVTPSYQLPDIGWSDSEERRAGLAIETKLCIQTGKFVNFGFKILRGKKDIPHYLDSTWYEQQMTHASTWNVLFSDTDTMRHWILDGASAIVFLCKGCLSLPYANATPSQEIWHSEEATSPNTAVQLLLHERNRRILISSSTGLSKDHAATEDPRELVLETGDKQGWTFEDLVQQLWRRLDLLYYDTQMPSDSETVEIQLKRRILRGHEYRDLIEGESMLKARTIQLKSSAQDWYSFAGSIGTINILGSGFEDLVGPLPNAKPHYSRCQLYRGVPSGHDYLAIPISVLKNTLRKHRRHTKRSVHLATHLYWTNPQESFTNCPFHNPASSRCTSVITQLSSHPKLYPKERTSQRHAILDRYVCGAIIFGRHPPKLDKRYSDNGEPSNSNELVQTQSADSGIELNSPMSSSVQDSLSTGASTVSYPSQSSTRKQWLSWFGGRVSETRQSSNH